MPEPASHSFWYQIHWAIFDFSKWLIVLASAGLAIWAIVLFFRGEIFLALIILFVGEPILILAMKAGFSLFLILIGAPARDEIDEEWVRRGVL